MVGFPEAVEDAYAADSEEATSAGGGVKRQRSMKNREFGLYASRLRQPKRGAASDVPGSTPRTSSVENGRLSSSDDLNDDLDSEAQDFVDDPVPQLPPLPLSPISPRWASLANSNTVLYDHSGAAAASAAAASGRSSPAVVATGAVVKPLSRGTSSSSSSKFPGLSSHPYVAEPLTPDPSPKSLRESSPVGSRNGSRPTTARSASALSAHRPGSRDSAGTGGSMVVENFSRPRKPSIKQSPLDSPPFSRLRQPDPMQLESTPSHAAWPRDRARRLSISSNKSSSTVASLPTRPSNDYHRSARHGPTAAANGGMISPGLPRPPMAYSRAENMASGPAPGTLSHAREPLPWIVDEELRSSYRSQLTASTAQSTFYTVGGTERSSVLTKTSSRTSVSLYAGAAGVVADEGLSIEDVMGMYERGFGDSTGAEDNDNDADVNHDDDDDDTKYASDVGDMGRNGDSSSRAEPSATAISDRILEAMDDSLPIPSKHLAPFADEPHVVRDSGAFFRNSGLPSSLPKNIGLGLAASRMTAGRGGLSDETSRDKHDSAKMLDNDIRTSVWPAQPGSKPGQLAVASPPSPLRPPPSAPSESELRASSDVSPPPTPNSIVPVVSADDEDPELRDRYGFRKQNQYITREQYDSWNDHYSEYIARRRKKWILYLKDSGLMTDNPNRFPPPSVKTKRFIRKGIPPEWRGAAWFYYAGGPSIVAKHPGVYDKLISRAGQGEAKEVDSEAIERDLHRTFPDNIKFKFEGGQPGLTDASGMEIRTEEPEIVTKLRRVLLAFSIYNPRIGYCQSLNFLAGLLLLFVETEEQCFWLLNVITRVYLPGTHEMSLEGSKVDLGVLMATLKDSMPNVWAKVGGELDDAAAATPPPHTPKHGTLGRKAKRPKAGTNRSADALGPASADRLPPITLCMTAWFMSCFIGTLPIETTLRVWDVFFYEGSKTLFRVALAIFKLGESEIRAVADPMEMFGVVQALPRRLLDCNMLMDATFRRRNGFGHISQETIEDKRRERRDWLKEARKAAAPADEPEDIGPVAGDIAGDIADLDDLEVPSEFRRKGTLFGRRKERRPAEVM